MFSSSFLLLHWNSSWWQRLFNSLKSQHLVTFLIADAISSSNAWIHALSFNDFIRSCIASYSCLKLALSGRFTCIAITYTAKTWHSLCSYTQNDSNVFAHALQLIYDNHTVIAKAQLSFCAHTHLCDAVNRSISIFWSIYMRRKYINQNLSSSFSWMIIQRT